jgi:hypothetical protein
MNTIIEQLRDIRPIGELYTAPFLCEVDAADRVPRTVSDEQGVEIAQMNSAKDPTALSITESDGDDEDIEFNMDCQYANIEKIQFMPRLDEDKDKLGGRKPADELLEYSQVHARLQQYFHANGIVGQVDGDIEENIGDELKIRIMERAKLFSCFNITNVQSEDVKPQNSLLFIEKGIGTCGRDLCNAIRNYVWSNFREEQEVPQPNAKDDGKFYPKHVAKYIRDIQDRVEKESYTAIEFRDRYTTYVDQVFGVALVAQTYVLSFLRLLDSDFSQGLSCWPRDFKEYRTETQYSDIRTNHMAKIAIANISHYTGGYFYDLVMKTVDFYEKQSAGDDAEKMTYAEKTAYMISAKRFLECLLRFLVLDMGTREGGASQTHSAATQEYEAIGTRIASVHSPWDRRFMEAEEDTPKFNTGRRITRQEVRMFTIFFFTQEKISKKFEWDTELRNIKVTQKNNKLFSCFSAASVWCVKDAVRGAQYIIPAFLYPESIGRRYTLNLVGKIWGDNNIGHNKYTSVPIRGGVVVHSIMESQGRAIWDELCPQMPFHIEKKKLPTPSQLRWKTAVYTTHLCLSMLMTVVPYDIERTASQASETSVPVRTYSHMENIGNIYEDVELRNPGQRNQGKQSEIVPEISFEVKGSYKRESIPTGINREILFEVFSSKQPYLFAIALHMTIKLLFGILPVKGPVVNPNEKFSPLGPYTLSFSERSRIAKMAANKNYNFKDCNVKNIDTKAEFFFRECISDVSTIDDIDGSIIAPSLETKVIAKFLRSYRALIQSIVAR